MNYYAISALLVFLSTVYLWLKKKYSYWSDRGVVGPAPVPFLGNYAQVFFQRKTPQEVIIEINKQYPDEKFIGIYQGGVTTLIVKEPEFIKRVLITDFNYFHDRLIFGVDEDVKKNLAALEGESWKALRHKLTPIFSSGKLKSMVPLISKSLNKLLEYTDKTIEKCSEQDIRPIASKYTLDSVGSSVFGVDMDAFNEKDNLYKEVAIRIFQNDAITKTIQMINLLFPGLINKLGIKRKRSFVFKFFLSLVNELLKERLNKPKTRKDFMDFMIELKEEGKATRKDGENIAEIEITDVIIAAQAFVFYTAGFEPSSMTLSLVLHELCQNQEIQDRVYTEISSAIKRHGSITYEAVNEMTYLEMVVDETMRKYPPVTFLARKCVSRYTFPGTNITLDPDIVVGIPVYNLHHDPKYYPDPEKFDPERFSSVNKPNLSSVFLPFGDGPRNCIGTRFAKTVTMIGLAGFLNKYKVEATTNTKKRLEIVPFTVNIISKDKIWMNIKKR